MEYKVGDKVLCKKSFHSDDEKLFTKGKYYTVEYTNVPNNDYSFYYDINILPDCKDGDHWIGFDLHEYKIPQDDMRNFREYFYTKEEMRKLKLKNINGI